MLSQTLLCIVFVTISSVYGDENQCDKQGVLFYEQIGCKPVKEQPGDLCPSSFDCNHLQEAGEHCTFKGRKFKNREEIPSDLLKGHCAGSCFCNVNKDGGTIKTSFTCAAFDCAEFLGGNPFGGKDCYRTYKLDDCCSSGQTCPPFGNIAKCQVDGKSLNEGERFEPKDACQNCICKKGYKGKYETPFCKRASCSNELRDGESIKNKCAPVYQSTDALCCPIFFLCPKKSHIFLPPPPSSEKNSKVCKFGEKDIKLGQLLLTNVEQYSQDYSVRCECKLPPFLTCTVFNVEPIKL